MSRRRKQPQLSEEILQRIHDVREKVKMDNEQAPVVGKIEQLTTDEWLNQVARLHWIHGQEPVLEVMQNVESTVNTLQQENEYLKKRIELLEGLHKGQVEEVKRLLTELEQVKAERDTMQSQVQLVHALTRLHLSSKFKDKDSRIILEVTPNNCYAVIRHAVNDGLMGMGEAFSLPDAIDKAREQLEAGNNG